MDTTLDSAPMTAPERIGTAKAHIWMTVSDINAILSHHSGLPGHTERALRQIHERLSSTYERIDRSYE